MKPKVPTCLAIFALLGLPAQASPRDTARTLYQRLAGVPPSASALQQTESLVAEKRFREAAALAMSNREFYSTTLRNWVAPWTTQSRSADVDFNDFIATAIGIVRDDVPFDQALYGDILYTANDSLVSADGKAPGKPIRPYIMSYRNADEQNQNIHYTDIQKNNLDLSNPNVLVRRTQSEVTQALPVDIAGLLTTRAAAVAYFDAGTNRRMFRYTMINFLCHDLEQLHDTTVPDYRVRRDVDRKPGGDSRVYKNTCVGCHAIQDGFGGAFAPYHFQQKVLYKPGGVQAKYNQNNTVFPEGYVTVDNSWVNLITKGVNASLGWRDAPDAPVLGGMGAHSLGRVLAHTEAFSRCMTEQTFRRVCLRAPAKGEEAAFETIRKRFEAGGRYSLKGLFGEVTNFCFGGDL